MKTWMLWIEGPEEDNEFTYHSLERALFMYDRWKSNKHNIVALFECISGKDARQTCIKTNDPLSHKVA